MPLHNYNKLQVQSMEAHTHRVHLQYTVTVLYTQLRAAFMFTVHNLSGLKFVAQSYSCQSTHTMVSYGVLTVTVTQTLGESVPQSKNCSGKPELSMIEHSHQMDG